MNKLKGVTSTLALVFSVISVSLMIDYMTATIEGVETVLLMSRKTVVIMIVALSAITALVIFYQKERWWFFTGLMQAIACVIFIVIWQMM